MRWLPRAAAAAVLLAVGGIGAKYVWQAAATAKARVAVFAPVTAPAQATERKATARKATGGLSVNSTPTGAQVLVNGKARGVTPLTLADLPAGRYTIDLKSSAGTVQRTVTVAADKTAEVDEMIFSGWLAVYSPFDLVITDGARVLRLDDRNQIMLPPGRHELRLVNRTFGYEAVRQVELKPGELVTLSVTPPPSTMTVTATEAAEVWLDGARVGETPLNAVAVELGTHEIVVKRAAGGERRFTVAVTVTPLILNVDFSRPGA
jgi:archaellum component FlaG (FlaF/FlaG flagellin family)